MLCALYTICTSRWQGAYRLHRVEGTLGQFCSRATQGVNPAVVQCLRFLNVCIICIWQLQYGYITTKACGYGWLCLSLSLLVSHQNSTIWITRRTGRMDRGFHTRTGTTARRASTNIPPWKLWVSRTREHTQNDADSNWHGNLWSTVGWQYRSCRLTTNRELVLKTSPRCSCLARWCDSLDNSNCLSVTDVNWGFSYSVTPQFLVAYRQARGTV